MHLGCGHFKAIKREYRASFLPFSMSQLINLQDKLFISFHPPSFFHLSPQPSFQLLQHPLPSFLPLSFLLLTEHHQIAAHLSLPERRLPCRSPLKSSSVFRELHWSSQNPQRQRLRSRMRYHRELGPWHCLESLQSAPEAASRCYRCINQLRSSSQ